MNDLTDWEIKSLADKNEYQNLIDTLESTIIRIIQEDIFNNLKNVEDKAKSTPLNDLILDFKNSLQKNSSDKSGKIQTSKIAPILNKLLIFLTDSNLEIQKFAFDSLTKIESSLILPLFQCYKNSDPNRRMELINTLFKNNVLRNAVFISNWEKIWQNLDHTLMRELVKVFEKIILEYPTFIENEEWKAWIRLSRITNNFLSVINPELAQILLIVKRKGILKSLSQEDTDFLLRCYHNEYESLIKNVNLKNRELLLPFLFEYAVLSQTLSRSDISTNIIEQWIKQGQEKPRALSKFTNEEVYDAPIRGVGSPNGISVTMYYHGQTKMPLRIVYSGITGDRLLNNEVFSSMFTAALACKNQKCFLTVGGGILNFDTFGKDGITISNTQSPLLADIGILTPHQPSKIGPVIGLAPEEVFDLIGDFFERLKENSGIVSILNWDIEDTQELEKKIKLSLEKGPKMPGNNLRIRSNPHHTEGAGIIHIMPLLHRNSEGNVEQIKIKIPYSAFNLDIFIDLTHNMRHMYMVTLIENGRRREAMAKEVYEQENILVEKWKNATREEKDAMIKEKPVIIMTLEYDFETATWVEISPVEVDRETYEEINRPSLRNNAKKFADRYKVLCEHLEEVNKEDGIADTLAFGILIDAAIRGDKSIPITSPELYSIYDKWIDQTSSLLWIGIQEWAQLRQYPIESLARDNIIFQAILQKNRTEVYICPHVIIDLHDFDIIIDRTNGIMQVFQNGNTPSLRERMIPDLGIENPDDLYKTFCDWVLTHIDVFQERNEKENAFRNKIMKDKKMNGLIMLERGKRLIFKGQLEKAIECFESARSSLLSPIYFWGAIAYQMQRIKFRYGSKIKDIHAIYFLAFEIIRYHLHATQNLDHGFKEIIINQTLDEDAEDFLKQLKNDQSFIESLKKPNPEIILIEKESLKLSNEEENQKQLAISAILALDFLQVSENMKDIAQSISFNGISIHKLKRELEDLVEDMNRNCLYEPPGAPQIEKLSNISGGNKAFIKKGNINELEDEK